jgi:hypothetical protein
LARERETERTGLGAWLAACVHKKLESKEIGVGKLNNSSKSPRLQRKNNNNKERQTQTAKPIRKNKKSNQKTQQKHRQRQTKPKKQKLLGGGCPKTDRALSFCAEKN